MNDMDDTPKYVLCSLISKYGKSICNEPGRLEGMLRDLCGAYNKEIFVLIHALRGGVAEALVRTESSIPLSAVITTQATHLSEIYGFSMEISRWASESWAEALGIQADKAPRSPVSSRGISPNRVADDESIMKSVILLGDDRLDLRADAAEQLINTGEYAVPFLISRISNPDPGIRWRIAFILGEIGSPESMKTLRTMLKDPSGVVREVAGEALDKIEGNG